MPGRRLIVTFLFCISMMHPLDNAAAQNVKSTFDKSVDFTKYKKYRGAQTTCCWGSRRTSRNASTWLSSIPLTGICKSNT